ncbi:MAG: type II and III secretion system protein family protein [Planctomycetota bacterium]
MASRYNSVRTGDGTGRLSANADSVWQYAGIIALAGFLTLGAEPAFSQEGDKPLSQPTRKLVSRKFERLQLIINTSQSVALDKVIDTVQVYNDSIIYAKPISRSEIMISAMATGVSQVDLKTRDNETYSLEIVVTGDARELKAILAQQFPTSTLEVTPIQQAVVISGQVTADEHVEQVVAIAEQYYPTVINRVEVIGVHTVMLHTQIMEVSRTKLRELGVDWATSWGDGFVDTTVSGLITPGGAAAGLGTAVTATGRETVRFGVISGDNTFYGFIRALKQNNMAKVLADPTVVAIDGRPASFNSGGEFPILVPAGMGQVGVEFREYGTRLDFVAKVRGDGRIWLEVRPTISEIDPGRSVTLAGTSIPGLRSRFVETAVELKAGETLALAGLLQMRTEAESVGLPWISDVPYLGALFRRNREIQNEIELLILVTPHFAGPMQAEEVPCGGPGYNSTSPLDHHLYLNGNIEVPNLQATPPQGSGASEYAAPAVMEPVQAVPASPNR